MGRTLRAALPGAVGVVAVVLLAGCLWADVSYLSGDGLAGRQNGTAGSVQAQDHLIDRLQGWGPGPNRAATGRGAYVQTFGTGANVLGVVPGTDLAHEYVIVGAHYDGQPDECRSVEPGDLICNGATDNATGVAAVLEVGRRLADAPVRQRRSVILAFWDAEEEGRVGSRHYVANPLVPLSATVAYVNLDIQGANLRPSIRNTTFAIGSETGGPTLQQALAAASTASTLDTRPLSLVFGQGRSDHAEF
ncbi:MAG TPA: M20/M25/M40 family metallo-hydrolase, partial [Aquihabitans sp.]|nr:M20/M25/M40 family metallo-hydrolase [Aquihabitans sp.]